MSITLKKHLSAHKRLEATLSTALLLAFAPFGAMAHHVSIGGSSSSSGPINTVTPDTIGKGKWAVSVQGQVINYDAFSDEELEGFALGGFEEVHNTDAAYTAALAVEYGVTNDLSISVVAPYLLRYGIREGELEDGEAEAHTLGDARGFGDLTVTAKYRLLDGEDAPISFGLLAGLQIPTGKTGELELDGSRFEAEFQPGSGSWNPLVGATFGKTVGPVQLHGGVTYTFATEGSQDTNLGDNLAYNVAVSYRIGKGGHYHQDGEYERHQALDLVLELNGEWHEEERVGDEFDLNSGGDLLFLSPGLRYVSRYNWHSYVSVGIPIHEDLRGIQNDTDIRASFGVGVSF